MGSLLPMPSWGAPIVKHNKHKEIRKEYKVLKILESDYESQLNKQSQYGWRPILNNLNTQDGYITVTFERETR